VIVYHQNNVAAFAGNHVFYFLPNQIIAARMSITSAAPTTQMFGRHLRFIPNEGISDYSGRFA